MDLGGGRAHIPKLGFVGVCRSIMLVKCQLVEQMFGHGGAVAWCSAKLSGEWSVRGKAHESAESNVKNTLSSRSRTKHVIREPFFECHNRWGVVGCASCSVGRIKRQKR